MRIINNPITLDVLSELAKHRFGNLVKGVIDIRKGMIALDADLRADEESELLQKGSKQEDIWGINLYPELFGTDDFIEYDSMINLRPASGNMTRGVDNEHIRQQIHSLVTTLIKP